jgi:hypothetical protein
MSRAQPGHKSGELPPTDDDRKLSTAHHQDSIVYNLHHSRDHFAAIPEHLEGLKRNVGPEAAAAQAKKAAKVLARMQRGLEPYLSSSSKSSPAK